MKFEMKLIVMAALSFALAACSNEEIVDLDDLALPDDTVQEKKPKRDKISKPQKAQTFLTPLQVERYFAACNEGDQQAMQATKTVGAESFLYPLRSVVATPLPDCGKVVRHFRLGRNQNLSLTQTGDGEGAIFSLYIFDLEEKSGKISRQYTLVGTPEFADGPTVEQPTQGMLAKHEEFLADMLGGNASQANTKMAPEVGAWLYPPRGNNRAYGPVITGAADVASVLAFKWGAGAWGGDVFVQHFMHYALVGIPADNSGLERVMLISFDANPQSQTYEKIIKIDLMGPSGG